MFQTSESDCGGPSLPAVPRHVSLHLVGDRGLLFDAARQLLFSATPSATFLWCCLAEALPLAEILKTLQQRAGLSVREAERWIGEALRDWRAAGLLDAAPPTADQPRWQSRPLDEPSYVDAAVRVANDDRVPRANFRLLDTSFSVAFSDPGVRELVAPLLQSLRPARGTDEPVRLLVIATGSGFAIHRDDGRRADCLRPDEVLPLLLAIASHSAVHRCPALCAVHAGAVAVEGGCVLLAGRAGAGKSTFVAGLAAAGLRVLCDDTVLLAGDMLLARPLGGTVCIKEGSWPVLADAFPELASLPTSRRPDGRMVRYLPCSADRQGPEDDRYQVRRIVFPQYDASAQPSLLEVDPATAAIRLMTSMFFLDRPLDASAVERLIRWAEAIPCFEMRYPSLEDSVRLFRMLER